MFFIRLKGNTSNAVYDVRASDIVAIETNASTGAAVGVILSSGYNLRISDATAQEILKAIEEPDYLREPAVGEWQTWGQHMERLKNHPPHVEQPHVAMSTQNDAAIRGAMEQLGATKPNWSATGRPFYDLPLVGKTIDSARYVIEGNRTLVEIGFADGTLLIIVEKERAGSVKVEIDGHEYPVTQSGEE